MSGEPPVPRFSAYLRRFSPAQCAVLLAFLAMTAYFALASPRVPVAGGLGWDGQVYGKCAIDLAGCLRSRELSSYNLTRIFPSAALHCLLRLFGAQRSTDVVVEAFAAWNLAMIWLSLVVWLDACRRRGWRRATAFFGAVSLFVNFSVIRLPFYAPVYTDATALLLAMLVLWSYAAGRPRWSLAVLPAAAFTWPVSIVVAGCVATLRTSAYPSIPRRRTALLFPASCVACFLAAAWYFLVMHPEPQPYGSVQVHREWLPLSIGILVAYVYWATRRLAPYAALKSASVDVKSTLLFVTIVISWAAALVALAPYSGRPSAMNPEAFLRGLTVAGVVYPAVFLAAHVVYAGPWIVIAVALIPSIADKARASALPLYPVVGLFMLFVPMSETRLMTFFLPFAAFVLCMVVDTAVSDRDVVGLAALSLITSHFWLPMASGAFRNLLEFPAQLLFMHIGPWMGRSAYLLALVHLAISALVLAPMIRRFRRLSLSTHDEAPLRGAASQGPAT